MDNKTVVVPVEPTDAMLDAGGMADFEEDHAARSLGVIPRRSHVARAIYKAMIAAAPAAAAQECYPLGCKCCGGMGCEACNYQAEAATAQPDEREGELTTKEAWWAGYRAGKGLPPDTPRKDALTAPQDAQERDAIIEEVAQSFEKYFSPRDELDVRYVTDSIRALKRTTAQPAEPEPWYVTKGRELHAKMRLKPKADDLSPTDFEAWWSSLPTAEWDPTPERDKQIAMGAWNAAREAIRDVALRDAAKVCIRVASERGELGYDEGKDAAAHCANRIFELRLQPADKPEGKAEQQAEPVAWMWRRNHAAGGYTQELCYSRDAANALCERFKEGGTFDVVIPLYAHPPAQQRLTDEEIEQAAQQLWDRFAPAHSIEWINEPHKAEYREAARALLSRQGGEDKSAAADGGREA